MNAMKFCEVCDNMMYVELSESEVPAKKLVFTCRSCGNTVDAKEHAKDCIIDSVYVDDATYFQQYANPNIVHDPTLPHVDNIRCANAQCSRPPTQPNDVIYFKFDPVNMKYMYHCCWCRHFWYMK